MLAAPPRAGEGVHGWLYNVARNLHAHLPAVEIIALLESRVKDCGRFVSRKEIEDVVRHSLEHAWQPRGNAAPIQSAAKWPGVNQEQRAAIIRDGDGLVDLWEASRVRIEDSAQHTEEIIDRLLPGNPLLCCGKSSQEFDARPREDWRGELSGLQLIVPSAMSAITGLTKDGKESKHSLNNTGTPDEHAALLLHLGAFTPLVCAGSFRRQKFARLVFCGRPAGRKGAPFFALRREFGRGRSALVQVSILPDARRHARQRPAPDSFFLNFKSREMTQ